MKKIDWQQWTTNQQAQRVDHDGTHAANDRSSLANHMTQSLIDRYFHNCERIERSRRFEKWERGRG